MAERYFSATRALVVGRNSSEMIYETVVSSSPPRFDTAYVQGALRLPAPSSGGNAGNFVQVQVLGPKTAISTTTLFLSFQLSLGAVGGYTAVRGHSLFQLLDLSSNLLIRVVNTINNNTAYAVEYWNGTAFVQAGGTFTVPPSALNKYTFEFNRATQTMNLWINNNLVTSATSMPGIAAIDISLVRIFGIPTSGSSYLSEVALADFDLRAYRFASDGLTDNGFYNDGGGNAADTNNTSFADFKNLPAASNSFTGTIPARTFSTTDRIEAVMITAAIRGVTPTLNGAALMRIASTDYTINFNPAPTAGFEYRQSSWALNPNTALPWTHTGYNTTEYGVRALA